MTVGRVLTKKSNMNEIISSINNWSEKLNQQLEIAVDISSLEAIRIEYSGSKGVVKNLFNELKKITDFDKKKAVAEKLNEFKDFVETEIKAKKESIENREIDKKILVENIDLSFPGVIQKRGARHPLSQVEKDCLDVLRLIGFEYVDGPEVETPFNNFDALNIPEHHPARDMQDTFWLENNLLLRSHTTTVQARILKERKELPIRIVSPGRVYRNEAVDATHLATFHQFEGLYIDKKVKFTELKGTIEFIIKETLGTNWLIRFKPKFYPYTEPSIGVDISEKSFNPDWLTIGGAGMVHPQVFRKLGHNPNEVSGFAFGLGISRMVSLIHNLSHIKTLYENDIRVHKKVAHKKFI